MTDKPFSFLPIGLTLSLPFDAIKQKIDLALRDAFLKNAKDAYKIFGINDLDAFAKINIKFEGFNIS